MPLEISEIGIRMAVGDPIVEPDKYPLSDDHINKQPIDPREKDELVKRCVRDVLMTLRIQGDR